jgi:hypothetical protein
MPKEITPERRQQLREANKRYREKLRKDRKEKNPVDGRIVKKVKLAAKKLLAALEDYEG